MLKIATYTKQDLVEIFNTERLDNIKRSLTRLGYEYETNGKRGNNLKLTITKCPDAFKMFCINRLGIPAQSDFYLLRNFFYYFFCDEEFAQLPVGEMERIMRREGKPISRQTISKWLEYLRDKGVLHLDYTECYYYVSFKVNDETFTEEITKEKYLMAWKIYWNIRNSGGEYHQARSAMCKVNGGTVFKKAKVVQNAFFNKDIADLIEVIIESINGGGMP